MSDPYVGEIRLVGFNFAPRGWLACNGQLLAIADNDTLFQLIGTTYGGDGVTTFALPDLRSRLPVHQGNGFTLAQTGGVEQVTLTSAQLPTHSHAFQATTGLANQGTPGGVVPAQAPTVQVYAEDTPLSAFAPGALSTVGGNQPHDNQHPHLVLSYVISLYGIFPSQT